MTAPTLLVIESPASSVFVWRGISCWLFVGLVYLAWFQRESHVKHGLPGECVVAPCNTANLQSCWFDPANMTPRCVTKYEDAKTTFEGLLVAGFVLGGLELLLSLLHAGRQSVGLNGLLLAAHVVSLGAMGCFLASVGRWAYFWIPFCGGLLYPVSSELFALLHGRFKLHAFAVGFLLFVGCLVPFILYAAGNGALFNGWIPVGVAVTLVLAFMTALAVRLPVVYSPPDSMTERME